MTRPTTPIRCLAAVLSLGLFAGAALAKDTGYLFVSSENDNAVTVLDGKSFQVVKAIATGERPRDMKLSADRSQVFVIASNSERVDVIDIAKLEANRTIKANLASAIGGLGPGRTPVASKRSSAPVRRVWSPHILLRRCARKSH